MNGDKSTSDIEYDEAIQLARDISQLLEEKDLKVIMLALSFLVAGGIAQTARDKEDSINSFVEMLKLHLLHMKNGPDKEKLDGK